MNRLMIIGLFVLSSCSMIKQKERMVEDSLFKSSVDKELHLEKQIQLKTELIWNRTGKQAVVIVADAPFRWHVDSGLIAGAGHFEVFNEQEENGTLLQKQQLKSDLKISNHENEKREERVKTVRKQVEQKDFGIGWWVIGFLLMGFFLWKLSR